jgi:hypothetical protein
VARQKVPPIPEEVKEYFRKQGSIGGKKGSIARMKKLTPEQRSAIAKNAVGVREAKKAAKRLRGHEAQS